MSDAEAAADVFDLLMGSDVAPRKDFIVEGAASWIATASTPDRDLGMVSREEASP